MIHKTVVISGDVKIGEGVTIEPYAVITGPCNIGEGAYIGAHAVIGAPAQSAECWPAPGGERTEGMGVFIGPSACLREYVTVHQGIMQATLVSRRALVMAYSHVSHDTWVGRNAVLSTGSTLGGFTTIGESANLGQHVVTHPWVVIGAGAMVGLNTSVIRDVEPCLKVVGTPARSIGMNTRFLEDGEVPVWWCDQYADYIKRRDDLRAAWKANA